MTRRAPSCRKRTSTRAEPGATPAIARHSAEMGLIGIPGICDGRPPHPRDFYERTRSGLTSRRPPAHRCWHPQREIAAPIPLPDRRLSTSRVLADASTNPAGVRAAPAATRTATATLDAKRRLRHREIDQRHRSNIRIATSRSCQLNHHTSQRGTANRGVKTGDHRIKRGVEDVLVVVVDRRLCSHQLRCHQPRQLDLQRKISLRQMDNVAEQPVKVVPRDTPRRIAAARSCSARNALATTSGPGPRLNPQQRLALRPLPHPHLSSVPHQPRASSSAPAHPNRAGRSGRGPDEEGEEAASQPNAVAGPPRDVAALFASRTDRRSSRRSSNNPITGDDASRPGESVERFGTLFSR